MTTNGAILLNSGLDVEKLESDYEEICFGPLEKEVSSSVGTVTKTTVEQKGLSFTLSSKQRPKTPPEINKEAIVSPLEITTGSIIKAPAEKRSVRDIVRGIELKNSQEQQPIYAVVNKRNKKKNNNNNCQLKDENMAKNRGDAKNVSNVRVEWEKSQLNNEKESAKDDLEVEEEEEVATILQGEPYFL